MTCTTASPCLSWNCDPCYEVYGCDADAVCYYKDPDCRPATPCEGCERDHQYALLESGQDDGLEDQETGPQAAVSASAVVDAVLTPSSAPASTEAFWSSKDWTGFSSVRTCTHAMDALTLSDGTVVYATAHSDRFKRSVPDVGVYLDRVWHSETFAYSIGWQDYGLPTPTITNVLRVARLVLEHARSGEKVEIACIGSHGRTGTFLAILELLAQQTPDAPTAISMVRSGHCSKAVETASQEWYVACVAAVLRGEDMPPKPRVKKAKHVHKTAPKKVDKKKNTPKKGTVTNVPKWSSRQSAIDALKRGGGRK